MTWQIEDSLPRAALLIRARKMASSGSSVAQKNIENSVNSTCLKDFLQKKYCFKDIYCSEFRKFYDSQIGAVKMTFLR